MDALADEERMVLLDLALRLARGQREIGALNLAKDKRDWRQMATEELWDFLMYRAFERVQGELK